MRIALFGGSFDPPHVAHQMACLYALSVHPIDEVWMVPCYQHPFDKRSVAFAHRVAMCRLATALLGDRVRVCEIEEELADKSYTLITLRTLRARHPEHDFVLLIGADLLRERERWYGWPELQKEATFLVIGRQGVPSDPTVPTGLEERSEFRLPQVSSTRVRELLRNPQQTAPSPSGERSLLADLVPQAVLAYIKQHGLYKAGP